MGVLRSVGRPGERHFITKPSTRLVVDTTCGLLVDRAVSWVVLMCCNMRMLLVVLSLLDSGLQGCPQIDVYTVE